MYQAIEVDKLPMRVNNGERARQLREFINSGKQAVKLAGIDHEDVWKVYCGLYNASKRNIFAGKVRVIKRGDNVYLYRMR